MSYTMEQLEAYRNIDVSKKEKYDQAKEIIRIIVSTYYDQQKIRISVGNRIVQMYYQELGVKPSMSKDKMDKEAAKLILAFEKEYDRITDAIVDLRISLDRIIQDRGYQDETGHKIQITKIVSPGLYSMMATYSRMKREEKLIEKNLTENLEPFEIYHWLKSIKGIGPLMAGVLIAYIDIYKAKYVSSITAYTGLDTLYDPKLDARRGRTKGDTIMREYISKDGEVKQKKSLTYNPFVKTKMLGVLTGSFLKQHSDYAVYYYSKLMQLDNDPERSKLETNHKKKIAKRYMINMFYKDLFVKWKQIEGLPVPMSYEEEFLHMAPHKADPYEVFLEAHPEYNSKLQRELKNRKSATDEDSFDIDE